MATARSLVVLASALFLSAGAQSTNSQTSPTNRRPATAGSESRNNSPEARARGEKASKKIAFRAAKELKEAV
jgi:hypothetical protein